MNKRLLAFVMLASFFLTTNLTSIYAQDTTKTIDHSLAGQYREILQKSKNNDQGNKIVNPSRLASFNRNFSDSLKQTRNKLIASEKKIAEQNKTISTIKADLSGKEQSLTKSQSMVDEISILGIQVNKSTYNWMVWGLVVLLGGALAFVTFQSACYRKEARYRTKLFSDLSDEFQSFKTKASEKEKKLARELQTEKNRIDELLGR